MRIFALFFLFAIALAPTFIEASQTKNKQTTKPAATAKKKTYSVHAKATPKKAVSKATPKPKPKATPKKPKLDEAAEWEKAAAITDAAEAIAAFKKFIAAFPKSERLAEAERRLSGSEVALADAHFELNEIEPALKLYAAAAADAPKPIPDTLFKERLSKVPSKLFWKGYRKPALDFAAKIEEKADAPQLQELAAFYLTIESGDDARRAAEASIALAPDAGGYLMLGLAKRVDFDLEGSAAAYQKALELDPENIQAKRGLAEAYRSLGTSDEAAKLYREILAADPSNLPARTGVILSLFESGKAPEGETELAASLAENPNNVMLLSGAAYWYSSHGEGQKAVEFAKRAIAVEPRFVWGHIALARGQMLLNMPLEAEKTLLAARRYGNFPTMDYELARAQAAAGFYREAAEGIARNFSLKDGAVTTKLGGRVERTSTNIGELISFERRASLFAPLTDADKNGGSVLVPLLEFWQAASSGDADVAKAASAFEAAGSDAMKLHRELFAASLLVDKKLAPDAAIELLKNAATNSGTALAAPDPTAAILADELYSARTAALAHGETIVPSPIAGATLSGIVRSRIEELAGAALAEKGEPEEALIRYKRSLSVAPADSVWQRSVNWRIGTLLASQNDLAGALPYYLKGYKGGLPDAAKYAIVKSAYSQVKGNLDGFEAEAGPDPLAKRETEVAQAEKPTPAPANNILGDLPPLPGEKPVATPEPSPTVSPSPESVVEKPAVEPTPGVSPTPEAAKAELFPAVVISIPKPGASPTPSASPTPTLTETPAATTTSDPIAEATPTVTPTPEPTAGATPRPSETPAPTPTPTDAPLPATTADSRPRIVKAQAEQAAIKPCVVTASEIRMSMPSGEERGVIVGTEDDRDLTGLTAVSDNEKDVVVRPVAVAGIKSRSLYVIKSLSDRTGIYHVKFSLPCGSAEVEVTVEPPPK